MAAFTQTIRLVRMVAAATIISIRAALRHCREQHCRDCRRRARARAHASRDRDGTGSRAAVSEDRTMMIHDDTLQPHRLPAATVIANLTSDSVHGLTSEDARQHFDVRPQPAQDRSRGLPGGSASPSSSRISWSSFSWSLPSFRLSNGCCRIPARAPCPTRRSSVAASSMLNAVLGFVQESRAEKSVRALMALAAPDRPSCATASDRIPTHDIVPGDILMVEAGDKIAADARLIEDANLHTDEAPLTGGAYRSPRMPSRSTPKPASATATTCCISAQSQPMAEAAIVVATGMNTEVGRIAGLLEAAKKEATPLQQELDRTGRRLSVTSC